MANLRVDKITSTETFETTGSVQFDGTGDQLTIPESTDFQLASSAIDFTIEAWVYGSNFSGAFTTISAVWNQTDDGDQWLFSVDTSGVLGFVWRPFSNSANFISGGTLSTDTWHHVAVTRSGNTFRLFVNGLITASGTNTGTTTNNTQLQIGKYAAVSNSEWEGHISNLRIIKGKALYTENFTPPTRELTVTPETVLLACQHKTDASHEKTGKTITVNGNAVASELTPGLLTDVVKSGGNSAITGSVEFDGTGDYLQLDNDEDFQFGTGDWSIEFWWNGQPTGSYTSQITTLVSSNESGTWRVGTRFLSTNQIYFSRGTGTGFTDVRFNVNVNDGEWHHIAFVRSSGVIIPFVDGVNRTGDLSSGSVSDSSSMTTTNPVKIGYNSRDKAYINGFVSNLRVIKGTALYTDNFIPPTRELKNIPGTVLLCCQDSNDPTQEATGKTITGYGDLDTDTTNENLITNGNFTTSATDGWTIVEGTGTAVLGTAQSATFGDGNHLVLTGTGGNVYLGQEFTTKIGSSYLVNCQSNGQDQSYISTDSDKDNAIITDIRNQNGNSTVGTQRFVATQTSYYVILQGGTSGGNFDTVSVYKVLTPNRASNFTPQVGNDGSVEFVGPTKINTENYFYLPTGDTVTRDSRSGRGLFSGGYTPSNANNQDIQYITISSMGNAIDFGQLDTLTATRGTSSCSSKIRGIWGGGYIAPAGTNTNIMNYVTISTTGNAQGFGELFIEKERRSALANNTRGIWGGGSTDPTSPTNTVDNIDYVTIASTGDAQDFGNLTVPRGRLSAASSPTRGLFCMGNIAPTGTTSTIDYITISSTGNAIDFGDMSYSASWSSALSSSTRGIFAGGAPGVVTIEYVTISSKGDSQDFGDATQGLFGTAGTSNGIRGVLGGNILANEENRIEYITISSTGNGKDFGDLINGGGPVGGACSDSHGGLG